MQRSKVIGSKNLGNKHIQIIIVRIIFKNSFSLLPLALSLNNIIIPFQQNTKRNMHQEVIYYKLFL